MWYKFDVFRTDKKTKKSKKVSSHQYPTYEEAKKACAAITHMPEGMYFEQFRENGPFVKKVLGGYTCGKIQMIN